MLQDLFLERHRKVPGYKKYYFQQDGATPHMATIVQNWLKSDFFLDKKENVAPSLTRLEYLWFFLWGYLKSVVYNPMPKTIDDLKANITREIKKNIYFRVNFC